MEWNDQGDSRSICDCLDSDPKSREKINPDNIIKERSRIDYRPVLFQPKDSIRKNKQ